MLSALAVSGYVLPPPTLFTEDGRRVVPTGDTLAKLARLAESQARARTKLKQQRDRFDALYNEASQLSVSPEDLDGLVQELRIREQQNAAMLLPKIEQTKKNLESPKAKANTPLTRSWRRSAEESLEIAISWLELYQNLQIRLLRLASDRRLSEDPGSGVLSSDGEIDKYLQSLASE